MLALKPACTGRPREYSCQTALTTDGEKEHLKTHTLDNICCQKQVAQCVLKSFLAIKVT